MTPFPLFHPPENCIKTVLPKKRKFKQPWLKSNVFYFIVTQYKEGMLITRVTSLFKSTKRFLGFNPRRARH